MTCRFPVMTGQSRICCGEFCLLTRNGNPHVVLNYLTVSKSDSITGLAHKMTPAILYQLFIITSKFSERVSSQPHLNHCLPAINEDASHRYSHGISRRSKIDRHHNIFFTFAERVLRPKTIGFEISTVK